MIALEKKKQKAGHRTARCVLLVRADEPLSYASALLICQLDLIRNERTKAQYERNEAYAACTDESYEKQPQQSCNREQAVEQAGANIDFLTDFTMLACAVMVGFGNDKGKR
jgi:hypothetical protein